jgi:PAS domain S-box-containing protein
VKNNQPVTQREVDYPESDVLVSRTDLKGSITDANAAFVKVSGFALYELVGKNHNIVRHPDMPEWAFGDLWATVKSGRPWRGIVKNRCKNGDYYWVRATVSPIVNQGQVTGYLSFRKKPSRQEIMDAEALYRAHPGQRKPKSRFSLSDWFSNISLRYKIQWIMQPVLILVLSLATYAIHDRIKSTILNEAVEKADAVGMQVIDSANMLMVTGAITDPSNRKLMIKKIIEGQKLTSLRLLRTDQVVKQYGPGLPEEQLNDPLVASTIEASVKAGTSIPYAGIYHDENGHPMLRVIVPYIESHDFHGTDCLTCHAVASGSSNGASDITIDLSEKFAQLRILTMAQIIGQLILQLILFFLVSFVVKRFVENPVNESREHLNEIVAGDFTRALDISRTDEIGSLFCSLQSSKVLMGSLVERISTTAKLLNDHAGVLSHGVLQAERAAVAQSDASQRAASGIEEISVGLSHVADNTQEVSRLSENSAKTATEGGALVKEVVSDISAMSKEVQSAAQAVRKLGEQSNQIAEIVDAIKGIADQTNLLALNAAIEAARAGDVGRGFAVVADEVRSLADKTASSTVTIGKMVTDITTGTKDAITMIEAAVRTMAHGEKLAATTGTSVEMIVGEAKKSLSGVTEITNAIKEQNVVMRDVAKQVETIASMAEENSISMKQVEESSNSLGLTAAELAKMVAMFRV